MAREPEPGPSNDQRLAATVGSLVVVQFMLVAVARTRTVPSDTMPLLLG